MASSAPYRIKTISDYHRHLGLTKHEHPLISVIHMDTLNPPAQRTGSFIFDFYLIALKNQKNIKFKYGQHDYGFAEDMLFFMAPKQVLSFETVKETLQEKPSGWLLLIHPDFIWNSPLAKNIRQYEFFDYSVGEALMLSDKEKAKINSLIDDIEQEYNNNLDHFSQDIMIAHIETLLTYSQRFYHRQFLTRKKAHHQVLDRLEKLLADYFNSDELIRKGLPTVNYVAQQLNMSPTYLSSLLRVLTGQNTQQHIHDKLIGRAKEMLSTTDLTVSEVAYALGFEHLQSFSKLFKSKTSQTPMAFRASFN